MPNSLKQIIGWILLLAGLLVIAWTLWSSYGIFNNKQLPPQIFALEKSQIAQKVSPKNLNQEQKLQQLMQDQLGKLLPLDAFSATLFNLIAWSIFAGILIFGGGKIAQIGTQLLK